LPPRQGEVVFRENATELVSRTIKRRLLKKGIDAALARCLPAI
jgi:hypothetical protein